VADKPWKANERKKCAQLRGVRTGPTGRDLPDCQQANGQPLPLIAPELKLYARLQFLEEDFKQAKDNATKVGRMPILGVKERGRGGRDRVVMDWDDFLTLYELALQAQS
jgi:hypothetical protein